MLLRTVLFSAASGTSFRIGSAISRIGLICATETATAAREEKAEEITARAERSAQEMVNQHEIVQRAYTKANEIVNEATQKAEEIMNNMKAANHVKVVKKDKGLIERTESSKIVLTEDNRQVLND